MCTLLVYIDDATRRYLELHGKPVAFYSDKHSVFRVNQTGATSGDGLTQFGRALHELNIDILYANSSQAKGRVERMNKTLQDRLVKILRLEGIATLEAPTPSCRAFWNASTPSSPRCRPATETCIARSPGLTTWTRSSAGRRNAPSPTA